MWREINAVVTERTLRTLRPKTLSREHSELKGIERPPQPNVVASRRPAQTHAHGMFEYPMVPIFAVFMGGWGGLTE
jgi:hypothetical protein